jgi:hypothetical protein
VITDPGRDMAATMVGGAGGSVLVSALMRAGVAPKSAAVAVAIVGGLGALALRGMARQAAIGAAAASLGRFALMWMQEKAAAARLPKPSGIAAAFEMARSELAREEERSAIVINIPAPERAGGREEDVGVGADAGVAVPEHDRGGGVPEVSVGVGDKERSGEGVVGADRDRPAGDAALHEGGAASLCRGAGGALLCAAEWGAWRKRGAR